MTTLWTLDGGRESWGEWAERMAEAPASALVEAYLPGRAPEPGAWALDLGCGTGRYFPALAEAGFRVVGVDPTGAAVRISRQRSRRSRCPAWPVRGCAGALPLASRSVSFVLAVGVLFHLPEGELRPALREIRRVLRPGGRCCSSWTATTGAAPWRRPSAPIRRRTLATRRL